MRDSRSPPWPGLHPTYPKQPFVMARRRSTLIMDFPSVEWINQQLRPALMVPARSREGFFDGSRMKGE